MKSTKNVVVLGKFDGVHIGHSRLICKAMETGRQHDMQIVVYVIGFAKDKVITDDDDKEQILKSMGADKVIFRSLDLKLKNMSPEDFVRHVLLAELNSAYVIVGRNFRFGKERCGDSHMLTTICKDYGIKVYVIDTVRMLSPLGVMEDVSSTAVRNYISDGKVDYAAKYLGRPYSIKGTVTSGKHLGRKLGFPTINIYPPESFLDMKNGVYASLICIDGTEYKAITNVGLNPTVEYKKDVITETHILDEDIDCYGKEAEIKFIKFIRSEKCFKSMQELSMQIKSDMEEVKKYWDEIPL